MRILSIVLALVLICAELAAADPVYNPSVALQTIAGADITKPASRDNPLPVWVAPAAGAPGLVAVSVGLSSTPVLPAGTSTAWRWRFVQNTDAGVGLWCAFGATAGRTPPAVYLAPREKLVFTAGAGFVPAGTVNCIADALTGAVAVTAGQAQ